MDLTKKYFPLLLITIVLSCKPDQKTPQERKNTKDTIPGHAFMVKDTVTLTEEITRPAIDTTAVLAAFKKITKTDLFIKELGIESNEEDGPGGSVFDSERPILIGDLNDDHLDDAIMPFSIEGRGGGNNWDAHYAIFINNGGVLQYKYSFDRGGDLAETQTDFKSIKNGVIKGMEVPGFHFPEGKSTPVDYMYRKTELSELLTASEAK